MFTPTPTSSRIFLSWSNQDRKLKEALLADLLPALGLLRGVRIEWWEDSHLTCGEDLLPGIVGRLDEADYGLLLLSTRYLGSEFIRRHELPRFAGLEADKRSFPVALGPMPRSGQRWDLHGIERQSIFHERDKSFAELSGASRRVFAVNLADVIGRRLHGGKGYQQL